MPNDLPAADRDALSALVRRLQDAWNAADGDAFAADFTEDADFVNVRGEHHRGRAAIAAGHSAIFRTVYAGSTNAYTVEAVRALRPDVALVHVRSVLDTPGGPLAGRHSARVSMVLTRDGGGWRIASFHNTLEAPPAPPR